MDRASAALDLLAATQLIGDEDVAACWDLLREGIRMQKVGLGNLDELLAQLRAGRGMGLDELNIEIDPPGSGRALVERLDDQRRCDAGALIVELERLRARARPEGTPPPGGGATGGGGSPTGGSRGGGGRAGAAAHDFGGAAEPVDLLPLLAGFLGTTAGHLAGGDGAQRAQVERVRSAAQRLGVLLRTPDRDPAALAAAEAELRGLFAAAWQTEQGIAARAADLPEALRALGADTERFSGGLRLLTEWLEQRTPAAGAAVDRLLEALEKTLDPFLGPLAPTQTADALEHRSRQDAQDAIARRLPRLC